MAKNSLIEKRRRNMAYGILISAKENISIEGVAGERKA